MTACDTIVERPATLADATPIYMLIREHQDDLIVRPMSDVIMNIDRFHVCEDAGCVIACAAWQILPEVGDPSKASVEIQSVAVGKPYRRRHVGTRLIRAVLARVESFAPTQAIVLTFAPEFFRSWAFARSPKPPSCTRSTWGASTAPNTPTRSPAPKSPWRSTCRGRARGPRSSRKPATPLPAPNGAPSCA